MSAIETSIAKLKVHERAVLVRDGMAFKGTLFQVAATSAGDDAYWMLRGEKHHMALAIREQDTVFVKSPSPCLACTPPGKPAEIKPNDCKHCFGRFL